MSPSCTIAPEQGQLVLLRNRYFIVEDVNPYAAGPSDLPITRVSLECIDDDKLGETLDVIWEREVNTRILEDVSLPAMSGWDKPERFKSFLRAVKWSTTSSLAGKTLHCPFMGAIDLEPYQVAPAVRAVIMPRVNLLIADDVGLGKTIESGLVLQELISRNRVRDCFIVCPASLQVQWQEEMDEKFNLQFHIIDRQAILNLRREYGTHVNPWQSHPWLITSMDFIKRETHLRNFVAGLRKPDGSMASWDLLILDEAHNCAPSGRQKYVRDSKRTKMLRNLSSHFRHRLFVTATPHNGYTESFTALLELLDPLRFHRDSFVERESVEAVMIRRMKDEILQLGTSRNLSRRRIEALVVESAKEDREVAGTLDSYIAGRIQEARDSSERMPVRFALGMLKKRHLSSPLAFHNSMLIHSMHFMKASEETRSESPDRKLMEMAIKRSAEDQSDDFIKEQLETQALTECSKFFPRLSEEQQQAISCLLKESEKKRYAVDSKTRVLKNWIEEHLRDNLGWNNERLIVFTEYKDTLDYLNHHLEDWFGPDCIMQLYGGMISSEREEIKRAFQSNPQESEVRILLATDAAAEGLNLQKHCRYMIHWEIPWNPNKLEQRNGRIDRHGQKADEVIIHHFVHSDRADEEYLRRVVSKVQQQRDDLGGVAPIIEKSIESRMLGEETLDVDALAPRRALSDDVKRQIFDTHRNSYLSNLIDKARDHWEAEPDTVRKVLNHALLIEGHSGLEEVKGDLAGNAALLRTVPEHWGERCARSIKSHDGSLLKLVFSPEDSADRKDVTYIHLSHPLMKRAMEVFRQQMFTAGITKDERLRRSTYTVADGSYLSNPIMLLYVRLIAIGESGRKLHEELRQIPFSLTEGNLRKADETSISFLPENRNHPSISLKLSQRLEKAVADSRQEIESALEDFRKATQPTIEERLKEQSKTEQLKVKELIDTRIREISKTLNRLSKQDPAQLRLQFDFEEFDQYQIDLRCLEERVESLKKDRETQPEIIRRQYSLKSIRMFPLAIEFVLPSNMEGVGRDG